MFGNKHNTRHVSVTGDGITSNLDTSTYQHPKANEFAFKYNNNKFRFNLQGGVPKPIIGIVGWKFKGYSGLEALHTFGYFDLNSPNNPLLSPFEYYRSKIMPIDDTPLSRMYKKLGYRFYVNDLKSQLYPIYIYGTKRDIENMNQIFKKIPLEQKIAYSLGIFTDISKKHNLTIEDIVKQFHYSPFIFYKAHLEKTAVDILDDNTLRIYFPSVLNGTAGGSINAFLNGKQDVIATFYEENIDKSYIDVSCSTMEWAYETNFRVTKSLTGDKNLFFNLNPYHIKADTTNETIIVKPFGIIETAGEIINVSRAPMLKVLLDDAPSDILSFSATETSVSNMDSYNIRDGVAFYFNNGKSGINGTGNSTQIGPIVVNTQIKKTDSDFITLNKAKYQTEDKKNTQNVVYEIKYSDKNVYYRQQGETEFKNALLKDHHYVTHDNFVLGEESFVQLQSNIIEHEWFLYDISYQKKDNKLSKSYHNVLPLRGLKIYDFKMLGSSMYCHQYLPQTNTLTKRAYELSEIFDYNEDGYYARNDQIGETQYNSFKMTYFPGIISENTGFVPVGMGNVSSKDIDDSVFKGLRSYAGKGTITYIALYKDGQYKLLGFIGTDKTDYFSNADKCCNGAECGNIRKKGHYECSIDSSLYPQLMVYSGDIEPYNRMVKELKSISLPSIFAYDQLLENLTVTPSTEIIPDVKAYWAMAVAPSRSVEYITETVGHSYLLNKDIVTIPEIGLALDNSILNVTKPFNVSITSDTNTRGIKAVSDNVTIYTGIQGTYQKDKELYITISMKTPVKDKDGNETLVDKVIYEDKTPYVPFVVDKNQELALDTEHQCFSSPVLFFAYEGLANYLVEHNKFLNVLVDYDETKETIDESKITFELKTTQEGETPKAFYNGKELDVINTMGVIYYLDRGKAFPVAGEFVFVVEKSFLLQELSVKSNDEAIKKLVTSASENGYGPMHIYAGYELYKPVNIHYPYKLFYDTHFLAFEDKTFEVPNNDRVEVAVYLGEGNKFTATKEFNTVDNVYTIIKGAVTKNYIQDDLFNVKYRLPIVEVVLNRDITIDLKEQASFFASYFNNAKTQLIQDLREDTNNKRQKGAFVSAKWDTQEIYDQIRTLDTALFAIPVNFRCSDIPNESELKEMLISEDIRAKEITFDDLYNQAGSKVIFFDESGEVTISLENAVIEGDYFASYDYTKPYDRIMRQELLFNDLNVKKYKTQGSIAIKDVR